MNDKTTRFRRYYKKPEKKETKNEIKVDILWVAEDET